MTTATGSWTDGSVRTAVGTVAYSSVGSAATPVVLLHSLGLARESWRQTAEPLAEAGYSVYAIDLPGHGESPGPHLMLTIEDYARTVRDVLGALELGPVHLVGNSFGAIVAAEAAAAFPDMVESVVLVGCPAWPSRDVREEWLHSRSGVLLTAEGDAVAITHDIVETMFPTVHDEYVDVVAAGFARAGTWIRNVLWALYAYDSTPTFALIKQPVHVVYGEHDWLKATAPHLMANLTNASMSLVDGGAHMTPVNRPRELAATIADHLRTPAPTGAHPGAGQP